MRKKVKWNSIILIDFGFLATIVRNDMLGLELTRD